MAYPKQNAWSRIGRIPAALSEEELLTQNINDLVNINGNPQADPNSYIAQLGKNDLQEDFAPTPVLATPGSLPEQDTGPGFGMFSRAAKALKDFVAPKDELPAPTGVAVREASPEELAKQTNIMANNLTPYGKDSGIQESIQREKIQEARNILQKSTWLGDKDAMGIANTLSKLPWMQQQEAGVEQLKQMMQNEQNKPDNYAGAMARPIAALADSLTGSNILAGMPASPTGSKNKTVLDYALKLQDAQKDLSSKYIDAITKIKSGQETTNTQNKTDEINKVSSGNFSKAGGSGSLSANQIENQIKEWRTTIGSVTTIKESLDVLRPLVGGKEIPGVGKISSLRPDQFKTLLNSPKGNKIKQASDAVVAAFKYLNSGKAANAQEERAFKIISGNSPGAGPEEYRSGMDLIYKFIKARVKLMDTLHPDARKEILKRYGAFELPDIFGEEAPKKSNALNMKAKIKSDAELSDMTIEQLRAYKATLKGGK